jgi:hypothetical protein
MVDKVSSPRQGDEAVARVTLRVRGWDGRHRPRLHAGEMMWDASGDLAILNA